MKELVLQYAFFGLEWRQRLTPHSVGERRERARERASERDREIERERKKEKPLPMPSQGQLHHSKQFQLEWFRPTLSVGQIFFFFFITLKPRVE